MGVVFSGKLTTMKTNECSFLVCPFIRLCAVHNVHAKGFHIIFNCISPDELHCWIYHIAKSGKLYIPLCCSSPYSLVSIHIYSGKCRLELFPVAMKTMKHDSKIVWIVNLDRKKRRNQIQKRFDFHCPLNYVMQIRWT